jgi:hypothetical protein
MNISASVAIVQVGTGGGLQALARRSNPDRGTLCSPKQALHASSILLAPMTPQVNKWLVEKYAFKFILLLTSLHFFTGYGFLTLASREGRYKLFTRGVAPFWPIFKLALAGALSIALLNYSLRLNSVGTYQIMKVAVLPAVMALAFLGGTVPSTPEVAAAGLVVIGTLICTVTDGACQRPWKLGRASPVPLNACTRRPPPPCSPSLVWVTTLTPSSLPSLPARLLLLLQCG